MTDSRVETHTKLTVVRRGGERSPDPGSAELLGDQPPGKSQRGDERTMGGTHDFVDSAESRSETEDLAIESCGKKLGVRKIPVRQDEGECSGHFPIVAVSSLPTSPECVNGALLEAVENAPLLPEGPEPRLARVESFLRGVDLLLVSAGLRVVEFALELGDGIG